MKSILKKVACFGLGALIVLSCNKNDNPVKNGNVEVTFLKEGAKSSFIYKSSIFEDTFNTVIEKQITKDTFLVRTYSDLPFILPTQYYVLNNGILYTSFRLRDAQSYMPICKFNVPVGTTWNITAGSSTLTYTIDSVNASVNTGNGIIKDAIKIRVLNNANRQLAYSYVSPSVGMLGDGPIGKATTSISLKSHSAGVQVADPIGSYPITFGNFPFLKVGNKWIYNQYDHTTGHEDSVKIEILSKASNNVFTVELNTITHNEKSTEYWYEDNGMLMVYESGENLKEADPIYMDPAKAKVGYGWAGRSSNGTTFFYKIAKLNKNFSSILGELPCMSIEVASSYIVSQTNYWNNNKGQVSTSGFVSLELEYSNARKEKLSSPFLPPFTY